MPEYIEPWKFIRILDAPENMEEIFQGIDSVCAINFDPPTTEESTGEVVTLPEALWDAQNATIAAQSKFLNDVSEFYAAMKDNIPQGPIDSMLDQIVEVLLGYGAGKLIGWLVKIKTLSGTAAFFSEEAINFLVGFGFAAWDKLKVAYSAVNKLCDAMKDENTQLLALPNSLENYRLRREVLEQHEQSVRNVLALSAQAEQEVQKIGGEPEGQSMDVDGEALLQAIQDLRWNNLLVYGKDGKKILLTNKTMSEDS